MWIKVNLILLLFLLGADHDVLCEEDLPIHSPIINNDEDSISGINSLEYFSQSSTTTNEEITSSEILQTYPLTLEIEVFTFNGIEEFLESGMIITRGEDNFKEKD